MPSTKELDAVIAAAKAFGPLAALAEQAGAIKGFEAHLARLKVDCDDMERVREEKASKLAKVSGDLKVELTRAEEQRAELFVQYQETVRLNGVELTAQRVESERLQAEIQAAITHRVKIVDDGVHAQTAEARATLSALQREITQLTAQRDHARRNWQEAKAALEDVRL